MKISKKTREDAARLCAIAACEPDYGMSLSQVCIYSGATPRAAQDLAMAAKNFAYMTRDDGNYETACAEAESMLRTGWVP